MPVTRLFRFTSPMRSLDDLKERLSRVRWPDEIPGAGWDYGSNLDYIKELVEYWRTAYDWRAQEAALNALPHFKTSVDGQEIHFIHQRGQGDNPMPLIVTHGWPSTFFEMTKIIPRLTNPADFGGDPGGRLRRSGSFHARLRFFRPDPAAGCQHPPHRRAVGQADDGGIGL